MLSLGRRQNVTVIIHIDPKDNKPWYTANRDLLDNEGSPTIYHSLSIDYFMRLKKKTFYCKLIT